MHQPDVRKPPLQVPTEQQVMHTMYARLLMQKQKQRVLATPYGVGQAAGQEQETRTRLGPRKQVIVPYLLRNAIIALIIKLLSN